jgi:hypothetical protein
MENDTTINILKDAYGIFNQKVGIDRSRTGNQSNLSKTELLNLANRHYQPPAATRGIGSSSDMLNLIQYFQPTHMRAVSIVNDIDRLKAIAPEIDQAKNIIVPSILSPNDLQDTNPTLYLSEDLQISEELRKEILDYLYRPLVLDLELGRRMKSWCETAMFESGSAPNLILPESTLAHLMGKSNVGKESFSLDSEEGKQKLTQYLSSADAHRRLNQMYDEEIYQKRIPETSVRSNEKFKTPSIDLTPTGKSIYQEALPAVEKIVINHLEELKKENPVHADIKLLDSSSKLTGCIESITARIVTELEDGDTLKISENPEVLRFGSAVKAAHKRSLSKNVIDRYQPDNKVNGSDIGSSPMYDASQSNSRILNLIPYIDDTAENFSEPFIMQFPAEAVIRICTPGNIKDTLGYFVLIDNYGQPIMAQQYLGTLSGSSSASMAEASYNAMFGTSNHGNMMSSMIVNPMGFGNPYNLQDQAVTKVFDTILDSMMRKKLQNVGFEDVAFGKYTTIATCMFHRMLARKKTSLVFIPDELMTYVAFDYRPDGCGKSRVENAMYLLSIRTMLVVANTMASMRNSIARKEVTIDLDEKETQPERILQEVANMMKQKYGLQLTSDPRVISQMINDQNTTIKMKGEAFGNFGVEIQDTQQNVPKADQDLMDSLTSAIINVFGAPHSVMNELNEAEYARSVATTNLFFAQKTLADQDTLTGFTNKFIRTYCRFSSKIKKELLRILEGKTKNNAHDDTPVDTVSDKGSKTTTKNNQQILNEIIRSISVSLPAPNIAPTKSQNEVLKAYLEVIEDIVNNTYPDDLVSADTDSQLQPILQTMRAELKMRLTLRVMSETGLNKTFEVPDITEHLKEIISDLPKRYQEIENLGSAISKTLSVVRTPTDEPETEEDSSSDNSTSEFSF